MFEEDSLNEDVDIDALTGKVDAESALHSKQTTRLVTSDEAAELLQKSICAKCVLSWIIFAGPGTGKTYTIRKTLFSLQKIKVDPSRILVMAFTKNNVVKMIQDIRLQNQKSQQSIDLSYCNRIKTFHSFAKNLIMTSIIQEAQKNKILKQIIRQNQNLKPQNIEDDQLLIRIMREVDYIIDNDQSVDIYYQEKIDKKKQNLSQLEIFIHKVVPTFFEYLEKQYTEKKTTFGYSLKKAKQKIKENRSSFLNQIDYIIIDEFQDFNKLQLNILREINKIRPRSFLFLGDPDQNIYQFRSAKQSNIEVFIKELKPNSYMIKETRRLSEPLLKLAKEFIKLNNSRRQKRYGYQKNMQMEAKHNKHTQIPKIQIFQKQYDQLQNIIKIIQTHKQQYNLQYKDIAVLTRGKLCNSFLKKLKQLLNQAKIPYQQKFDRQIIDRVPVKRIFDTLRYFYYLKRKDQKYIKKNIGNIFSDLFGISKSTINFQNFQKDSFISQKNCPDNLFGKKKAQRARVFKNAFFKKYWNRLEQMIEKKNTLPSEICQFIWEQCYQQFAGLQETKDIQEFFLICKDYDKMPILGNQSRLEYFIRQMIEQACSKYSIKDVYDGKASVKVSNKIKLFTIHQAKGLQYKLVILPCMSGNFIQFDEQEGQKSHFRLQNNLRQLRQLSEQQINLYYTAITRSSRFLYVSRSKYNKCFDGHNEKSQFTEIKEICKKLFKLTDENIKVKASRIQQQANFMINQNQEIKSDQKKEKKAKRIGQFSTQKLYEELLQQGFGRREEEPEFRNDRNSRNRSSEQLINQRKLSKRRSSQSKGKMIQQSEQKLKQNVSKEQDKQMQMVIQESIKGSVKKQSKKKEQQSNLWSFVKKKSLDKSKKQK